VARPLRTLVLLAGLILGGQLVGAAPAAAAPPDQPPDVTGQIVSDARATLNAWNPKVAVVVTPVGGDFPNGADPELAVVVSQALTGPATAVRAAPQIALSVTARVPDVRKLTQADADDLIVRSGLRSVPSPRTAPLDWIVLNQSPPAGTAAKWGQPVEIVLGAPALVEVPDLRGQSEDQARSAVDRARLTLHVGTTGSGTRQPLVVTRQDPVPGTRVAPGSTVSIALGAPGVPTTDSPTPPPSPAPPRFSPTAAILTGGSLLLLLALLLLLGLLLTRTRRRPRWVRTHVKTQVRAADAATLRLEPSGNRPDITVTITRREAPPNIRLEEIRS